MDPQNDDGFYAKFIQSQSVDNLSVMGIPVVAENFNRPLLQIMARGSTKKSRGDNYSDEEDIILVNAWLSISMDGTVGTEQKFDTLWDRIHAYYHECKKSSQQERSKQSLGNRWSRIQGSCNKFCACLTQIEKLNQSGQTKVDKQAFENVLSELLLGLIRQIPHTKMIGAPVLHLVIVGRFCDIIRNGFYKKMKQRPKKGKGASGAQAVASASVDIGDKDVPINMDECERPPGKKTLKAGERKRKYKEEKSALFEKVMSSLKEERKQQHEEKMQKIDKLSQIEEKKAAQKERLVTITEKKLAQEEKEKENQIMLMDISLLDAVQQEYVQKLRQQILQNMQI